MWMSARRFVVITRFVRVALGKTNRASSPGTPGLEQLAVQPERAVDLLLVALAQVGIALGDRVGEHRRRALELDVALALLVERDARPMADELVRQRPRHAADGEGEDDVLDRRAVPGLDDRADQLLHLERVEVAVDRAPEDLVGVLLGVARPAGRVDDRDVDTSRRSRGSGRAASPASRGRAGPGSSGSRSSRGRASDGVVWVGHRRASLDRAARSDPPRRPPTVPVAQ